MTHYRLAFVTVGSLVEAEKIAEAVVDEGLAACVNIVPTITSVYRWQGKIEKDQESKLVMKTVAERVDELIARVVALHSYDVCEVTVVPIVAGNTDYLNWIDANTSSAR